MASRRGHGEGSIFQRGDGRWIGSVDLGWRDGKRQRRHYSAASRREVADKVAAALHEANQGTLPAGKSPTLAQFLTTWLQGLRVAPSTARAYEQKVRVHLIPALGHIRLDRLSAIDVDRMLDEKQRSGLKPRSVHHLRTVLRTALAYAERKNLVARNVVKLSEPIPVKDYEAVYLTPVQASSFLAAAKGDRLEAVYILAITLGMREGELLGLLWKNVDLEKGALAVRTQLERVPGHGLAIKEGAKWGSDRTLTLPEFAVRALRAHRTRQLEEHLAAGTAWEDHGLVFTTTSGRPVSASHLVSGSFHRVCDRAGIEYGTRVRRALRFHDLRHSAATLLLAMGVSQRAVMEVLGHSSMRMTAKYMHVAPQLMHEAAAAMDRALSS